MRTETMTWLFEILLERRGIGLFCFMKVDSAKSRLIQGAPQSARMFDKVLCPDQHLPSECPRIEGFRHVLQQERSDLELFNDESQFLQANGNQGKTRSISGNQRCAPTSGQLAKAVSAL